MQRYTYMRLIKVSHYEGLFTREFDCELFLLILKTFNEQVITNEAFNNATEQGFIVDLLDCIFRSPQFSFVLDFLEESELAQVRQLINEQLTKVASDRDQKVAFIREELDSI